MLQWVLGTVGLEERKHSFAQLPGKFRMKRQAHGGGGSLWNKLTGTLNKCIGVSFFRRTISPTVSSQERYS